MAYQLPAREQARLDELHRRLADQREHFAGYPVTTDLDYGALWRFLEFPLNNVGDPFRDGTYGLQTHDFEREVVRWFGDLLQADAETTWGYVTNGGTEGNLYGLFLARELFPNGICYYSQDTHYSVAKNLRLLKMQHIMIKSQPNGEIDYDDLSETIRIHRDVPPIIFANIGTTMKEAVDRVPVIRGLLKDFAIPQSYIHCDAALAGMIRPFIPGGVEFDFRQQIDSIAISGHKFIGSPVPCGVVLANRDHVRRIARSIEYVGTLDTTISGSRNGFTPLVLWYAIHHWGREGFAERVQSSLQNAQHAVDALRAAGIAAWRNPDSITVVFPKPPLEIARHWQIAINDDIGHLLVMPSLTRERIDAFVADLAAAEARNKEAAK